MVSIDIIQWKIKAKAIKQYVIHVVQIDISGNFHKHLQKITITLTGYD